MNENVQSPSKVFCINSSKSYVLTIVKIDPGVINQGLLHTFDHYQMQEKSGPYHKYSLSSKLNVRDSAGSPRIRKYVMVLSFRTFMGSKTDKF